MTLGVSASGVTATEAVGIVGLTGCVGVGVGSSVIGSCVGVTVGRTKMEVAVITMTASGVLVSVNGLLGIGVGTTVGVRRTVGVRMLFGAGTSAVAVTVKATVAETVEVGRPNMGPMRRGWGAMGGGVRGTVACAAEGLAAFASTTNTSMSSATLLTTIRDSMILSVA